MNDKITVINDFNIRTAAGLSCPHCGRGLAPHAVEFYEPGAWRMCCQCCFRDVLTIQRNFPVDTRPNTSRQGAAATKPS
jgi:hypothetical protein